MTTLHSQLNDLANEIKKMVAEFFRPFVENNTSIHSDAYKKACLRLYQSTQDVMKIEEEIEIFPYRTRLPKDRYELWKDTGLSDEEVKERMKHQLAHSIVTLPTVRFYIDEFESRIAILHVVENSNYLIGDNYEEF